jgi:hypothetical protein
MKRMLIALAGLAGAIGVVLLAVGTMQWLAVVLLVICLIGMGFTVGGAAASSLGD